jgi:hypothetical protein
VSLKTALLLLDCKTLSKSIASQNLSFLPCKMGEECKDEIISSLPLSVAQIHTMPMIPSFFLREVLVKREV